MGKTSKRKKKQNQKQKPKPHSIDRISQLPEHIQHNILNFLEEKAVAGTRVLSKAWRSIVHSRPVVDIKYEPHNADHEGTRSSRDRVFINYVNESMQRALAHGQNLKRLRLLVRRRRDSSDLWAHNLNHWMQQSVGAKVSDLTLVLTDSHEEERYVLPLFVFSSENITRLTLGNCRLGQCSTVSLPKILVLSLSDVALTREAVERFQSGCPNLEVLKLHRCHGLSSIHVSGLARLRRVELILCNNVDRVTIVAPELRVFKASRNSCHYICRDTKIDLLACESTLRKLSLSSISVTEMLLTRFVSKFLELKSLELDYLDVKNIGIPNQKLRKLKVENCSRLEGIEASGAVNLQSLAYSYNKLPFYSLSSSLTLDDKARFHATFLLRDMFESLSESFEQALLQFNRLGDMKLIVLLDNKDVIVYEELDENFIAMLYNNLYSSHYRKLTCVNITRATSYEYMVDFMFGCFQRYASTWLGNMETLSIVSRKERNNKKVLEVLTENALKENEEPNCCRIDSYKCYRHLLGENKPKENEESKCYHCGNNRYKCWKHALYDATMIYDEKEEALEKWFKSFDTREYDITSIELEWNVRFPRRL